MFRFNKNSLRRVSIYCKYYLGVLQRAMKLYETDDILVKLNIIEIIQSMGNSEWNAKFLSQQKFFKEIIDTAMVKYNSIHL